MRQRIDAQYALPDVGCQADGAGHFWHLSPISPHIFPALAPFMTIVHDCHQIYAFYFIRPMADTFSQMEAPLRLYYRGVEAVADSEKRTSDALQHDT